MNLYLKKRVGKITSWEESKFSFFMIILYFLEKDASANINLTTISKINPLKSDNND